MILYIGTNTIPVGPKGDPGGTTDNRAALITTTGGNGQVIAFSTPLPTANYSLQFNDFGSGLGIQLVTGSKTINGFAINSIVSGDADYTATLYQ
jgi:hypothetical protein